jgi:hypothetical protein
VRRESRGRREVSVSGRSIGTVGGPGSSTPTEIRRERAKQVRGGREESLERCGGELLVGNCSNRLSHCLSSHGSADR